jgi:hypothetical protein
VALFDGFFTKIIEKMINHWSLISYSNIICRSIFQNICEGCLWHVGPRKSNTRRCSNIFNIGLGLLYNFLSKFHKTTYT